MMANESVDCEFWLPDDLFFGEDDFIPVQPCKETAAEQQLTKELFLSGLDKPVSVDEDNDSKDANMAGSPQSTLCANGFLSSASGGESPDGPAQVSSPPPSDEKENREKETLDMLLEAAGQVMRLKLNEEEEIIKPLDNICVPSPKPAHTNNGFFPNSQSMSQKQMQAAQFHYLRQQQMLKQQQFTNALLWEKQRNNRKCGPPLGLPRSAWPPLAKPPSPAPAAAAGMRAVFLAGTKKESAGTGVFLPKRPGSPTVPRKKSVCSTVLLPARVVQALNLNLDELGAPARCTGGYVLDHDAMIGRSNAMNMNKKWSNSSEMQQNRIRKNMEKNEEICLPKEWTY